jgi:hypothetical protein
LNVFTNASAMPLLLGLSTGVKQGSRFRAVALHLAWGADVAKPLLDTVYHHVPDHRAGDPGRCGHPADDFAVMAVQGKGCLTTHILKLCGIYSTRNIADVSKICVVDSPNSAVSALKNPDHD